MTTGNDDDVLAAALIQIAAYAERISDLDAREASHHQGISARVDAVTGILGRHATVVKKLDGLNRQVAALGNRIVDLTTGAESDHLSYQPLAPIRWWQLSGTERETALARLRAWVEQVYQPAYGHLAASLPLCWEGHPLCLYTLDWLSELWSALYLSAQRPANALAARAEWQLRLLPAAASQMAQDGARCHHGQGNGRVVAPANRPGRRA